MVWTVVCPSHLFHNIVVCLECILYRAVAAVLIIFTVLSQARAVRPCSTCRQHRPSPNVALGGRVP